MLVPTRIKYRIQNQADEFSSNKSCDLIESDMYCGYRYICTLQVNRVKPCVPAKLKLTSVTFSAKGIRSDLICKLKRKLRGKKTVILNCLCMYCM